MTTQRLIELVRRYPAIRDVNLRLDPDDITSPGSWAQEEILSKVEPILVADKFSLVVGKGVYTSSEVSWLPTAGRFLPIAYYTDTNLKHIEQKDVSWIDRDRTRIAEGGSKSLPPRFFYILHTNPKSLGIWYIPDTVYEVNFRFFRKHAVADNLSIEAGSVKDPLIPDDLEELLVKGTVARVFDQAGRKYREEAKIAYDQYNQKLAEKTEEYQIRNAAILEDQGLVFG